MRLKLDENIPTELVEYLSRHGHDVHSVKSEGLQGKSDAIIWSACVEESRFLITQDVGLADSRQIIGGDHPGVLVVRVREPGKDVILARIVDLFESERVESWVGNVVVATQSKVRIRKVV